MAKRPGVTAAEFLAELANDEEYQRGRAEHDREHAEGLARDRLTKAEIVRRLRRRGCTLDFLDEATPDTAPPAKALPVLAEALRPLGPTETTTVAAVAHAVVAVAPGAEGARVLLEELARRTDADDEPVRWTLGTTADEHLGAATEEQVLGLLADPAYGTSRMALLPALGRLDSPRARAALVAALAEEELVEGAAEEVAGHGISEAAGALEAVAEHGGTTLARTSAAKALRRLRKR